MDCTKSNSSVSVKVVRRKIAKEKGGRGKCKRLKGQGEGSPNRGCSTITTNCLVLQGLEQEW